MFFLNQSGASLAGVTFEAIDLDRFVTVTAVAETVSAPDHAVIACTGMTLDAILQTVFSVAYALVYCFIALLEKHLHVVLAHPLRLFHALAAFAYIELGHAVTFRGIGRCAHAKCSQQCE
jgi:hypothetical protein